MERWSPIVYKRAGLVSFAQGATLAELVVGPEHEEIEISLSGKDIAAIYQWLTDSNGLNFSSGNDDERFQIAEELDRLGYLREISSKDAKNTILEYHAQLRCHYAQWAQIVSELELYGNKWTSLRDVLVADSRIDVNSVRALPIEELVGDNFFQSILRLTLRLWLRTEPRDLALTLEIIEGKQSLPVLLADPDIDWIDSLAELYAFGPDPTIRRLNNFFNLLKRVFDQDAPRLLTFVPPPPDRPILTLNAAIEFESIARDALQRLEQLQPSATAKIVDRTSIEAVIQQYFVDERFVETIAPAAARNVSTELKMLFRRYFVEELNHEQYDIETCSDEGIETEALKACTPLALTDAFCDLYVLLASEDLLSYVLSVVITEGLPSDWNPERPVPNTSLRGVEKHAAFNAAQYHHYLSRWLAKSSGFITPKRYAVALTFFLLLLELNHRLWRDIDKVKSSHA